MDPMKTIQAEVTKAIKEQKTFSTGYQWVALEECLEERGWIQQLTPETKEDLQNKYGQLLNKTNLQLVPYIQDKNYGTMARRIIKSNLLEGHQVDLVWFSNYFQPNDFHSVLDQDKLPLANKFKRTKLDYTTKSGLCETVRMQLDGSRKISHPRTYILKREFDAFLSDFNITSAISLLQYVLEVRKNKAFKIISPSGRIPYEVFEFAVHQCARFVDHKSCSDINDAHTFCASTNDMGWDKFQDNSYKMIQLNLHFKQTNDNKAVTDETIVTSARAALQNVSDVWPYLEMDGYYNIWILKPFNSCWGKGIHLCQTKNSILDAMKFEEFVAQKYIEVPLLIYGHKFDIRQWYLISETNPLTIWIWKEPYLRFSCETYNLRKLHEAIHVTNDCVQSKYFAKCVNETALPRHYMWTIQEFQDYLSIIGYPSVFKDFIFPSMRENIISATLFHKNNFGTRRNCFQVFGADFMLTPDFKPWLIEINDNPSMAYCTPVLAKLSPRCTSDTAKSAVKQVNKTSLYLTTSAESTQLPLMSSLKNIQYEVDIAIKERKTFTIVHFWPNVQKALEERGWVERIHPSAKQFIGAEYAFLCNKDVSELLKYLEDIKYAAITKRLIKSNLLKNYQVDFVWFSSDYIPQYFHELISDQFKTPYANKLKRLNMDYTSKIGLSKTLKVAKQMGIMLTHPRTYILKQEWNAFWDDYNITCAISLLKYIQELWQNQPSRIISQSGQIPYETFEFAAKQCYHFIDCKNLANYGAASRLVGGMGWDKFGEYVHKMVHQQNHFKITENKETDEDVADQANEILQKLKYILPDMEIDGYCNIWIMKPYNSSEARGIKLHCTRETILSAIQDKDLVIQKYLERPLLIYEYKFDIRQWYLISNTYPLTIWMWMDGYIRLSCQTYSLRKLHESIHISSNCVQHKYFDDSQCDLALPDYYMWSRQQFEDYLALLGYPNAYQEITYPGMKENIISATIINKKTLGTRRKTFELFGADFMVGPDFRAWLIELNQNPSMVHKTPLVKDLSPRCVRDVIKVILDDVPETIGTTVGGFELMYKEE